MKIASLFLLLVLFATTSSAQTLQFSSATFSVLEGNSGTNPAVITVTASPPPTSTVMVSFATSNGFATAGSDYQATSGTLSFAAGVTSATFTINILGDTAVEPDETINLALSNPQGGATLGVPSTAVFTIVNDDTAPVTPTLSIDSPAAVSEGNAGTTTTITFTVTLSATPTTAVTVTFASADGSATLIHSRPCARQSPHGASTTTSSMITSCKKAWFAVPEICHANKSACSASVTLSGISASGASAAISKPTTRHDAPSSGLHEAINVALALSRRFTVTLWYLLSLCRTMVTRRVQ
jgi:hypothetical protein